jgi:GT2 family glycosyltransferase
MENKLGIVILNYLNWKDTDELMQSLLKQSFTNYEVIIVDNDSRNQSFEILKSKYSLIPNVNIINTKRNLGFARGNNEGIKFLKKLGIRKILVINNDVVFVDKEYLFKLNQIKYADDVGAIGTKIIGSDKKNQNPINGVKVGWIPSTKSYLSKLLLTEKNIYIKNKLLGSKTNSIRPLDLTCEEKIQVRNEDFFLHGAAILFTENYLKNSNGFYPNTFLFFEENILSIIFKKLNLKFMYDPSLLIYHKEDCSSALAWENASDVKRLYTKKSIIESFKVLSMSKTRLLKILNR